MRKYGNTYTISINANQDIDLIENVEERYELEELIDDEIMEAQSSIEYWCEDNKCDYELFGNHRCTITTNSLYADENIEGAIKCIEDNLLQETYITLDMIEG